MDEGPEEDNTGTDTSAPEPAASDEAPSPSSSGTNDSAKPASPTESAKPAGTAESATPAASTESASLDPVALPPAANDGSTRYGIEIGVVAKQDGLRPLWREFLTNHSALVAGLQPRRVLAPDKKWRLIAGPFANAAEAAQACALFKKASRPCEATVYAGDALDEPAGQVFHADDAGGVHGFVHRALACSGCSRRSADASTACSSFSGR